MMLHIMQVNHLYIIRKIRHEKPFKRSKIEMINYIRVQLCPSISLDDLDQMLTDTEIELEKFLKIITMMEDDPER